MQDFFETCKLAQYENKFALCLWNTGTFYNDNFFESHPAISLANFSLNILHEPFDKHKCWYDDALPNFSIVTKVQIM